MASNRLLMIPDLHASDGADAPVSPPIAIQDGYKKRIFSNWSTRLSEACKVGVKYGAEFAVLLGDNIDMGDSAPQTTWELVLNQLESEFLVPASAKLIPIVGNHEDASTMELSDFVVSYEAEVLSANRVSPVSGTGWPGAVKNQKVSSFRADETNFHIITLWGAPSIETIWDNTNVVYEGENINGAAQLEWLEDDALEAVAITKPVLVFCHNHLSDSDGQTTISDPVLSGTPDNGHNNIQTILSACAQKVTCFCGHFHRVEPNANIDREKDIITAGGGSAVDYYNLTASVLGRHAADTRGNTFFVIDVDTVLGVTDVKVFKYHNSSRDRYAPYDIGVETGGSVGRGRYR